jgi:integrase
MHMSILVRSRAKSGSYELRIKHKLLPRPFFATYSTEHEAREFGEQAERFLARGVIPEGLLPAPKILYTDIEGAIRAYERANAVPRSTENLLTTIVRNIGSTPLQKIDHAWAENWVRVQKLQFHRSPCTIRHHVGALARCLDWVNKHHPTYLAFNPLRKLADNYSTYSKVEHKLLAQMGLDTKRDVERDRRLSAKEEQEIVRILLARVKCARTAEERALHQGALLMFKLSLETAMRMRELYTLELGQIDLQNRTLFLSRTKNGDSRQVPVSSVALALLDEALASRACHGANKALLFPFWNGQHAEEVLEETTSRVSAYYRDVFDEAQCDDLHFHDLRHEAICRFFIRTKLTDLEISRISGHKSPRMLRRYMSLRGSELAVKLW